MLPDLRFAITAYNETAKAFAATRGEIAKTGAELRGLNLAGAGTRALLSGLGTTIGVAGLSVVIAKAREAVGEVADLGDAAEKAGVSAERLQVFRYQMEQTAGSAADADAALQKFTVGLGKLETVGGGPAEDAFKSLGVAIRDANGHLRDTDDILEDTLKRLAQVQNYDQRAGLASAIFGKQQGPALAAALNQGIGKLDELEKHLRSTGSVMSNDMVRDADDLDNKLKDLELRFDTLWKTIAIGAGMSLFNGGKMMADLDALLSNPNWATIGRFAFGDLAPKMGFPDVAAGTGSKPLELTVTHPAGYEPLDLGGTGKDPNATAMQDGVKVVADAVDDLNKRFATARDLSTDFAGTFVHDLMNGKSAVDSLADALDNLASQLTDLALNFAINSAFNALAGGFGAAGGAAGGFATNQISAIHRAGGGPVQAGRLYRVGENQEEYLIPGQNGWIDRGDRRGGGGKTTVNIFGAPADAQVERRQGPTGEEINVYIDKSMARNMATRGSRSNRTHRLAGLDMPGIDRG